jgi:hypothetical protein
MQYRLYHIRDTRIVGQPNIIDADDDWEAARKAAGCLDNDDLQIWQAERFVMEFIAARGKELAA